MLGQKVNRLRPLQRYVGDVIVGKRMFTFLPAADLASSSWPVPLPCTIIQVFGPIRNMMQSSVISPSSLRIAA